MGSPEIHVAECDSDFSEENSYSGQSTYLYSSRLDCSSNLAEICKILVRSDAFTFALDNKGVIIFEEQGRIKTQGLDIQTTVQGMGMTVKGHEAFMAAKGQDSVRYAFIKALSLLLSERKLFNGAFGFPAESVRIFLRPLAIQAEGVEGYELFLPHVKISSDGLISIALDGVLGFDELTLDEVVHEEVNKSLRNLSSVLCVKALHQASTECQIAQLSFLERRAQRGAFEEMTNASMKLPFSIDFLSEELNLYELMHTDQLTLTDVARNLLSVVARSVAVGKVRSRVSWSKVRKFDPPVCKFWYGKPLVSILSHTAQKEAAEENWTAHKVFVSSVMVRADLSGGSYGQSIQLKDLRCFDDFNSFYSEPVSLIFSSLKVSKFIDSNEGYAFDNLISDVQVLNEVAHLMVVFYAYASSALDGCKKSTEVTRVELQVLGFEESLYSLYKYGEVADYIEEIRRGAHLTMVSRMFHKKVEAVKKSLELDEKIASESFTRRITIIFGIIASAALSPELIQPVAKLAGISFDDQWTKIVGLAVAMTAVVGVLVITHFGFKAVQWLLRLIKN